MLRKSSSFRSVDILFALMLFSVFAAAVLMVLLSGAHIYRDTVDDMITHYEGRTGISYVTTKLRRCDSTGGVRIDSFGDRQALFLTEPGDGGREYETIIYMSDGMIREQYVEKGKSFPPQTGMPVLEVNSIFFSIENDNLLLIEYETEEGLFKTYVHLRVKGAIVS